jgi:hypothetical protein
VAVDDQDLVGVRPDGVDDFPDQAFFVPGRDDDSYALGSQGQGKGRRPTAAPGTLGRGCRSAEVRIGELLLYDQWFMGASH